MPFRIETKTKARVTSVSINGENHGKDIQPAVTLSMRMSVGNDWLANLSGRLKGSFYEKGPSSAAQGELPGTEQSDMPALRFPDMGPIPWTKEYTGLHLVIDHGIGGASDIVVADCRADNIVLTFKEGGTAEVEFKLKSNTADEHTRGQLTSTIKRDIEIRVGGPGEESEPELDIRPPRSPSRPKKGPTEAFLESQAGG